MKKFTLLIAMFVCAIGFSQQTNVSAKSIIFSGESTPAVFNTNVVENIAISNEDNQRELDQYAQMEQNRQANGVANSPTLAQSSAQSRSSMVDIIPIAGATETFTPDVGDNFFDPGGPGADYPNCACFTITTLAGVTELEFLEYEVFANFDFTRIYDGVDTSGILLFDNSPGGMNDGDITLADMIASHGSTIFSTPSGAITVEFFATGVVSNPGWNAIVNVVSGGGGGGGAACSQEHPFSTQVGGSGSSVDSDFKSATDIVVTAGEDFIIDTIEATFLTFAPADPPTTATIVYYEDNAGLPGTMIGTETVVPTILSSAPWVNPVANQYVTSMSLTPFTFSGDMGSDTTYWIEISMGTATNQATVFWEFTNDTPVEGFAFAQIDSSVGTWSIVDPIQELIYNYSGECNPIGGGADNDLCVDAIAISCGDIATGDTSDNTDTGGNPAPDEWYSFTGTGTPEFVTFSLCDGGTGYDSLLRVFDACGGTEIAVNDDFCGLQSELTFTSDGTSTYYVMIEGFASGSGVYSLEVSCMLVPPAPANDECTGAIAVSCGESVTGTTIDATIDTGVAVDCGAATITSPGVWYTFTDTSGLVSDITLTMCSGNGTANFDTKMSVFTGDCGAPPLTCVDGNDDTCGLQSEVSFQSDGVSTYYVLVHSFGGATGNFTFDVNCTPVPPPNDDIANSITITDCPFTDPGVAMPAATLESGNPAGCNIDGATGVWYNITPAGDGTITATIDSPSGLSHVTFYTAADENATEADLTLVDHFDNQCLPGTTTTIDVVADQVYYIFVVNTGGVTDISFDCDLLSIADNVIEGFSFYPNPSTDVININSQELIENVSIYNILGQKVIDQNIDATSSQINVANLAQGTYIMKATVNGVTASYKVIKK